ncbi:hypothetical protein C2G38_898670 [Gigaspora rosea]|uniref:Protein kinase domain-containing protein n=1 Tax=Gigaspora rosea TaxID=44941 RepID=A0A397TXX4_9GLOM|nr:hypothetical protein C2G38_898670 [Gigaspora rosea]
MKSANMGHIGGICNIGNCYASGNGVEKDYNKAFEYLKKSADMGDMASMQNVAFCYRNGIGAQRDIQSANHWFRKYRNLLINSKINKSLDIDPGLKNVLDNDKYKLSWIDYCDFKDIKEIGKGGFATVYYALWDDRTNNTYLPVALKEIRGSSDNTKDFVNELKNYCDIGYENPSFLECIGVSKNNDYIIVMRYAREGSLSQNLDKYQR